MPRLYIIGPVAGIPRNNLGEFCYWKKQLEDYGYGADIPHGFISSIATHEEAMQISIHKLTERNCFVSDAIGHWEPAYQGVALLYGWEDSQGARTEKLVAEACGIPCKTVAEWIEEAGRGDR